MALIGTSLCGQNRITSARARGYTHRHSRPGFRRSGINRAATRQEKLSWPPALRARTQTPGFPILLLLHLGGRRLLDGNLPLGHGLAVAAIRGFVADIQAIADCRVGVSI